MSDESFEETQAVGNVAAPVMRPRAPVPPMPPEIAKAVVGVMLAISKLEKKTDNQHEGYKYASIDDFLEETRPICAKNGLFIYPVEVSQEYGQATTRSGSISIVTYTFEFILFHESGASWQHPYDQRKIRIQSRGPQTAGMAKSYAEKQFMKSLFQMSAGEPDADSLPALDDEVDEEGAPRKRRSTKPQVVSSPANGERQAPPPLIKKKPEAPPAAPSKEDF